MNSYEILVIDDEQQIRKLLEISLESHNYKVRLAASGKEGLVYAAQHSPDLILLDLGLPDKDGLQILKELRMWYEKSIIILSVQSSESAIVDALDSGATDYLTKPFRTAELLARIRSALRRNQTATASVLLQSGDLEVDLYNRTLKRKGVIIKLTVTEYNLLVLMIKNEGRVLTHKYILKEIWGIGAQTETQYLRVFIRTLRTKIEEEPNMPKHILTESGVGYRFI